MGLCSSRDYFEGSFWVYLSKERYRVILNTVVGITGSFKRNNDYVKVCLLYTSRCV